MTGGQEHEQGISNLFFMAVSSDEGETLAGAALAFRFNRVCSNLCRFLYRKRMIYRCSMNQVSSVLL